MPLYSGLRYTRSMGVNFKRQLIMSLAVMLGGIVLSAGAFYFLVGNINAAANTIVTDKALADQQSGALAVVATLKRQEAQAAVYQAAMNKLLIGQDGLIGFNQWISNAAARHQVTDTVTFQHASPLDSFAGEMGFSLGVNGSIANIISFLNDIELEGSGYLVQIKAFTLTSVNGSYQLSSQGYVFYKQ